MHIRSNIIMIALAIATIITACGNTDAKKTGFSIKGKLINGSQKQITLQEITPKGLIFVDSTTVAPDGSFELKGKVNERTFCTLPLPSGEIILVVDSNTDMTLQVDEKKPDQYTVVGSPETENIRKLLQINNTHMNSVQALETKYAQYVDNNVPPVAVQQQIRREYDSIIAKRNEDLFNYVTALKNSVVPFFVTNYMPEIGFDFYDKIDKQFYTQLSQSKYAQAHHQRVEILRKTAVGSIAPEIVMADPFGKTIPLSSLRGKYVLVDFWASWCRPCRQENPNLVKAYNKYKTRGFEIFSVSLDDNRDAWSNAINTDKLLWTHVSDLMKWNSPVVGLYNIESIPFSVLIDPEGKILATNLRGNMLEEKLAEVLK